MTAILIERVSNIGTNSVRKVWPVLGGISDECNKGDHYGCSGCTCQCHGNSPGWLNIASITAMTQPGAVATGPCRTFSRLSVVDWGRGGNSPTQCSVSCSDCGRSHCDSGEVNHSGSHHCNKCGYTWG